MNNIGFIGAGKVGCSLGQYLAAQHLKVSGYYSRTLKSAEEGAASTHSSAYERMEDLVRDSEVIFVTVPDTQIASVWQQLRELPIQNKIISHCSGALSSAVFSDIGSYHAYGYSIHPFIPISDRHAGDTLRRAVFTVEGSPECLGELQKLLTDCGNEVVAISQKDKVRYHAAAVMASNLYVGLVAMCQKMLRSCGFSGEQAQRALMPLVLGNVKNIVSGGAAEALTGPIERGDAETVAAHLQALGTEEAEIYMRLSRETLKVARVKNPHRDYDQMERILHRKGVYEDGNDSCDTAQAEGKRR